MIRNYLEQLDDLLKEDIATIQMRVRSTFDQLSSPFEKNIVLFGAGNLGRRTLAGLRKLGIEPLAFSDKNSSHWDSNLDGVQVFSPSEAVRIFGDRAVFVLTILSDTYGHPLNEIQSLLSSYGPVKVVSFTFLYWKYADTFLPYFCLDLPYKILDQVESVHAVAKLWADDASRIEYLAQLKWRLHLDFNVLPKPVSHPPYFPPDLFSLGLETAFVDCGAFDGDTIRDFLEHQGSSFHKIFAFEPDKVNFEKLENYVVTLPESINEKIILFELAVGKRRETVHFEAAGTMQSVVKESGDIEVESVPLDEVLANTIPTYVKMDIEGAELDALLGMKNIIKEEPPILAISVYHKIDDLWQLPLLMNSLSDKYKFFLRPHGAAVLDLVCYAVPSIYVLVEEKS